MPRLKVRDSEMDIRRFRALVNSKQTIIGLTSKDVADHMGMSLGWYYTKIRNPDKLTRAELRTLASYLNFTPEERLQCLDNILDPNTKATGKRKVSVTLELTPDCNRRTINVSAIAKSTLVSTNPIATSLYITSDGNGEMVVAEMVPQIPGQTNMSGDVQEQPKILKLLEHQA